jgi:hypothetical protein
MAENGKFGSSLGDVRNLLGFLVAGFAGFLNFLGLKSAEIGVVLRNEPFRVGVVAAVLLIAVLTAVISVFVNLEHPVHPMLAAVVLLVAACAIPAVVLIIPAPAVVHTRERTTSIGLTWGFLIAAAAITAGYVLWWLVGCVVRWWRRRRHPPAPAAPPAPVLPPAAPVATRAHRRWWHRGATVPPPTVPPAAGPPVPSPAAPAPAARSRVLPDLFNLQCLLLATAVILTSAAAYGAMRVETISQTSTVAQIGDTLQVSGGQATLGIAVSASKLTTADWLGVNVLAVPSSWALAKFCGRDDVQGLRMDFSVQCDQDPCVYAAVPALNHPHCRELSEDVLAPDTTGSVQRTIDVVFGARKFQHVQVTAVTCTPADTEPPGRCIPIGAVSRLDIAVPGRAAK